MKLGRLELLGLRWSIDRMEHRPAIRPGLPYDPAMEFDAVLEPLVWGRNTYTIIKVPTELADAARSASTRRVDGTIEDVAVNVGLNRADVIPQTFIYVGRNFLQRLGARPGDVVRCILTPVDPDHVPLARDVADALDAAGRRDAFDLLSAPHRRRLLVPVEDAARSETRKRRIDALLSSLPEN